MMNQTWAPQPAKKWAVCDRIGLCCVAVVIGLMFIVETTDGWTDSLGDIGTMFGKAVLYLGAPPWIICRLIDFVTGGPWRRGEI